MRRSFLTAAAIAGCRSAWGAAQLAAAQTHAARQHHDHNHHHARYHARFRLAFRPAFRDRDDEGDAGPLRGR